MTNKRSLRLSFATLALAGASLLPFAAAAEGTANIYTSRQPELIQPLLDAFTEETGIQTEDLFLNQGLEDRVDAEGQNSPADVILTVDIGRLINTKEKGVTQPLENETISANIPEQYRDPEGHWFGLTMRGR